MERVIGFAVGIILWYDLHLSDALAAPNPFAEESVVLFFFTVNDICGELQKYKTELSSSSVQYIFSRTYKIVKTEWKHQWKYSIFT